VLAAAGVLAAAVLLAAVTSQFTRSHGKGGGGVEEKKEETGPLPGSRRLPADAKPSPLACCGYRMEVEGEVFVWQAPAAVNASDPATGPAIEIPEEFRTELFGNVIIAKAPLPPGKYRIEVLASENAWMAPGRRVFDVAAVSTRTAEAGTTGEVTTPLGTNIDLFALAGLGKPYTIAGTVTHAGGPLKVVFTTKADFAKVSAIRILNADGDKVAWLFARDMADLLKLPGEPPVVEGPVVWKDASAPLDRRVHDLIRRMTLREKVWQLSHDAPAIDRLGLPPYNYWSEALHGVARNGIATVFPQAIGMAASFDAALMHEVADTIATEGRAKFNEKERALAAGIKSRDEWELGDGGRYQGLTFWSPNINLFRDPRWGRGHETYGEDPLLTSRMAVAFIKGLQGDDPTYYKTLACAKHYAVHSGPESLRHTFDARPPESDFYDTYLPQFETAVREARVASVMGAYNRVYGDPACASPLLLKDLLRKTWGFDGYVVSDCAAITDIWANHRVVSNQAEAAAAAVLAGCDLECGANYGSLAAAVDLHLVGEGAIDTALGRVLKSRFQLGLFDPSERVPYARIGPEQNDTPAHAALALKMARESIVLLKNDGLLPLDPSKLKKVALVGPNADGLLPLLGNYNGTPSRPITVVDGLRAALPGVAITHLKGCDNAARQADYPLLPDILLRPLPAEQNETGLKAEYFKTPDFTGTPAFTRVEKGVDLQGLLEWNVPVPRAASPVAAIRYTGDFVAPADGTYRLQVRGNLPYRWVLDNREQVDLFKNPEKDTINWVTCDLKAGQRVPLILETRTLRGTCGISLHWDGTDPQGNPIDPTPAIVDKVRDADVILFAGGLDGHMEAEEGDIRALYAGFQGGDRTTIEMPAPQSDLLRALAATGKPVVLINLSGSAVAMPWEAEHLPAIVQAWYPGQAGGQAVAEVLVGAYNPAGRLPVTFYRSTEDLPAFTDYAMAPGPRTGNAQADADPPPPSLGRTYRYFIGTPLWSFGHGLSYTAFDYKELSLDKRETTANDVVNVTLEVQNRGARDGDEVVQLYVSSPEKGDPAAPRRRLVAFQRVSVVRGATERVSFAIPMSKLRTWDGARKSYAVRPGIYTIETGASSNDIRSTQTLTIR
jgi:beta-glucosidase